MISLADVVHVINETAFSQYLRESELAFPLTEAIHLIGLGISVGTVLWIDLRLMGKVMRDGDDFVLRFAFMAGFMIEVAALSATLESD